MADGEVGHDLGHQRLEAAVPPELLGVDLAVGHHDPAEVARLVGGADHHLEIIGNHGHGDPLRPRLKRLFQSRAAGPPRTSVDDREAGGVPRTATFRCHQKHLTGVATVCRGWLAMHAHSVAVRMARLTGASVVRSI